MAGGYRCSSGHVWTPPTDDSPPRACPVCGDTVVMTADPTAEAPVHRPAYVVAVPTDHPDPGRQGCHAPARSAPPRRPRCGLANRDAAARRGRRRCANARRRLVLVAAGFAARSQTDRPGLRQRRALRRKGRWDGGLHAAALRARLRDPARGRPRRNGRRLQGDAGQPEPAGRAQDDPGRHPRRAARARSLPPRGRGGRDAPEPAHRPDLRDRRGERAPLSGARVRRGRQPGPAPARFAVVGQGCGRTRRAAGPRGPLCPPAGRRPPRPEARQRAARPRRGRAGEGGGRLAARRRRAAISPRPYCGPRSPTSASPRESATAATPTARRPAR